MKQKIDLSNITLNYQQISIQTSLIETFCLKDTLPLTTSLNYMDTILLLSQKLNIDAWSLSLRGNIPISKLKVTPNGLYYNIDYFINEALSKYNLQLSTKNLDLKLENILATLRTIRNRTDLQQLSNKLFQEYVKQETNYLNHQKNKKQKKSSTLQLTQFLKQEIAVVQYLIDNLENDFKELATCNTNLERIDLQKLQLIIAYQIMKISQKNSPPSAVHYLKTYLNSNKDLLKANYQIKKYVVDSFGIGNNELYTIQTIYNFVYPPKKNQSTIITKSMPSPDTISKEQYDYNFFESKTLHPHELLTKYYQLGLKSQNKDELKELLQRKVTYYKSLTIAKIKVGLNTFEGYLGLCLEDGTIILDKFYENLKEGRIASDQAIYITKEEEFIKVTQLSKTDCIEQIKTGKIKAKRFIHKGNWEEKINQSNATKKA